MSRSILPDAGYMTMYAMILLKAILVVLLLDTATALGLDLGINLGSKCTFEGNVEPGRTYYIYSPNYPEHYSNGTKCAWTGYCPAGYSCKLDCEDVDLPESPDCELDRLLISKRGDLQLVGAERYCGRGSVSVISTGGVITAGLVVSPKSPGGRLLCALTAVKVVGDGTCSCGYKKTNRIVGGKETVINEYPMMAGVVDLALQQIVCGATIVSPSCVATTASCLISRAVPQTFVLVGEHDVTKSDSSATRLYPAAAFVLHPLYSEKTDDYNIAIIKTVSDIAFSERVGPVCLPFKYTAEDFTGEVTALGWGSTRPGGNLSNVLMEVDLPVLSPAACRASKSTYSPRNICTNTSMSKGPCQDDKGGPLLITDPGTGLLFLLGLIGEMNCATTPVSTNTLVTQQLLDWILKTIQPFTPCVK